MNGKSILARLTNLFGTKKADDRAELEALKKKARAAIGDDRIRVRLGDLLRKRGDEAGALVAYWEAAEINLEALYDQRALAVLKQIVRLAPQDAHAQLELARCFERLGRLREAAAQFEAAATALKREGRIEMSSEIRSKSAELLRACDDVEYIQPARCRIDAEETHPCVMPTPA